MTDSASITVTNHRLRKAMSNANDDDLKSHTKKMGEKLRSELSIKIGEVTKIYPMQDKAEVKVLNSNKIETCLIAHDILSEGMNVIGFPKGKTLISENGQTYIIPSEQLYGAIMTMDDKKNEKILLSFISLSDKTVFQNAKAGEYKIQVDDNLISVTDKYINIKSNNLFINGLPYGTPKLQNYYNKDEIDKIQKNNTFKLNEINEKLGNIDITAFKDSFAVEVTTLPDPSNETLGKIYLIKVTGTDDYDKYITFQKTDNSYVWEKIGSGEGGTSTVLWSDVTDKPDKFTPSSHEHGSLQNDGTLNSMAGTVKNIAVTDNNNNLKTIDKIPYSKISNTPTIPSKLSDLSNDSNFIEKSNTSGLIKNDGTIDSSTYLTSIPSHDHDSRYYTESEINEALSHKQDTLSSGVNIKTINGNDITGSGNINIAGGGGLTFNDIYPIGSIYMSVNNTSPSLLFGGTWVQLKDTFLLACGDTYSSDGSNVSTAQHGEATHSLTKAEMPRHNHTQAQHRHGMVGSKTESLSSGAYLRAGAGSTTDGKNTEYATPTIKYTGGTSTSEAEQNGLAHNNMPPYMAVYMWKRTE